MLSSETLLSSRLRDAPSDNKNFGGEQSVSVPYIPLSSVCVSVVVCAELSEELQV